MYQISRLYLNTRFRDTLRCTPKFMGSRDLGHTRFLHILCEFLRYWELKELLKGNVNMTTRKRLLNCYVFSVLKYGCESWTVNKNLMKRINVFEQWCHRRMLKISWKDKVLNTELLRRVGEKNSNSLGTLCNRNWRMLDMC